MITKAQALTLNTLHEGTCKITIGPRGGIDTRCTVLRRNGETQTWVTRPTEYRIPMKYGFTDYVQITQRDASIHLPEDCKPTIVDNRPVTKQHICAFCGINFVSDNGTITVDSYVLCRAHMQDAHKPH